MKELSVKKRRSRRKGLFASVFCSILLIWSCNSRDLGLESGDFIKICLNGFGEAEHKANLNDYGWSIEYFKPQGSETGNIYIATANNIPGVTFTVMQAVRGGVDSEEAMKSAPCKYPQIRRYTGENNWEKVFDMSETPYPYAEHTIGFRKMVTYPAVISNTLPEVRADYLYAASYGLRTAIWRSSTGNPNDWEMVYTTEEFGRSVRSMTVHNGRLYVGLYPDSQFLDPKFLVATILYSDDGINFSVLHEDGFGNPNNQGITDMGSWNGYLYAFTENRKQGFEVWKLEGPNNAPPKQIVASGGQDSRNEACGAPKVFNDSLYFGSMILVAPISLTGAKFKGGDIYRIDQDDSWQTIVGEDGLSGYGPGFNNPFNTYIWSMEEYEGWLYAGTWNQASAITWILKIGMLFDQVIENKFIASLLTTIANLIPDSIYYTVFNAGAKMYKTADGITWEIVDTNGLGNRENYGWRVMKTAPDGFYVGSANVGRPQIEEDKSLGRHSWGGLEIWKAVKKQ